MASCAYCNTTILFGGKRLGNLRFCNAVCEERGALVSVADQLPSDDVQRCVRQVHSGSCPQCNGVGPVDVHTSYRIWSIVLLTYWNSRPAMCCRSCGAKRAIGDALFSLILGWWGFPWGLLITPIQIVRNIVSLVRPPRPDHPTPELERMVRLSLATLVAQRLQEER